MRRAGAGNNDVRSFGLLKIFIVGNGRAVKLIGKFFGVVKIAVAYKIVLAPLSIKWRAVSSLMRPAPSTKILASSMLPKTSMARSTAALDTDTEL